MSYSQFVNDLKELKIKKKGRRPKVSPYKFYPSAAELEAQEALLDELKDYSRRLEAAANGGSVDAVYGVPGATPESFSTKAYDIAQKVSQFNMLAFADFSSLVVGERYFPSQDNKNQILQTWTDNFVNLCKSTNEEMRKKVAGVVSDGVLSGRNLREMIKEVQNTCKDFSRTKAELIATTEVGKLNSAIARNQSESAGIEYYEWSAAMDGRTRESHAVMDGKICKWGDENHYWEWVEGKDGKRELKRRDRPASAYKGAPGTDFRCRCVALPYVPEYEDDYVREEGPVRGVVQEANAEQIESYINGKNQESLKLVQLDRLQKESAIEKSKMVADLSVFRRILKKETEEETCERCNPGYDENDPASSSNCQRCVVAYVMRRMGYDVKAKPYVNDDAFNAPARNGEDDGWTLAFVGLKTKKLSVGKRPDIPSVSNHISKKFKNEGDGIYIVRCYLKNPFDSYSIRGHVVIADVKNGTPKYLDPQNGKKVSFNLFNVKLDSIRITKMDGYKPSANITDFVK